MKTLRCSNMVYRYNAYTKYDLLCTPLNVQSVSAAIASTILFYVFLILLMNVPFCIYVGHTTSCHSQRSTTSSSAPVFLSRVCTTRIYWGISTTTSSSYYLTALKFIRFPNTTICKYKTSDKVYSYVCFQEIAKSLYSVRI